MGFFSLIGLILGEFYPPVNPGRFSTPFRSHARPYYPSKFPLHHRAKYLVDRDLYGEIVADAREEDLTVIARMDSNRVALDFAETHPEWICRKADGSPWMQANKYITCINSAYYAEYLPDVMTEIIERSSPDGFADNSWAGLPRSRICHCDNCRKGIAAEGGTLPAVADWNDPVYRDWIAWNYRRRTWLWEHNNAVTTAVGGPDCRWMGMISGEILNNCNRFIDLKEILSRSEIVMLDHQRRTPKDGFEQNTEVGKRLRGLFGWEKLIPESTPQYQLGSPAFRHASMPPAEVLLWASAGFAGGIQPWWHHIGANHDDRRQYRTAEAIFGWHEANEDILFDRTPIARVGVVWSQANHDLFGRDRAEELTHAPYRGSTRALSRAGIDWLPVELSTIAGSGDRFDVLLLPNIGCLSKNDAETLRAFAARGGALVITGETGACDGDGARRSTPALADLFGLVPDGAAMGEIGDPELDIERPLRHSYLRLTPELRAVTYGPHDPAAPEATSQRHPVLAGFDEADTLPFGGFLPHMRVENGAEVLATWVPEFPIYPPETSWMRQPSSDIPAIVASDALADAGGRGVWFLADIDRCYGREGSFEHADLLANAVRWALADRDDTRIEGGTGLVALTGYTQGSRRILHLTSRVVTAPVPGRQDALVPLGPIDVRLRWNDASIPPVALRVSLADPQVQRDGEWLRVRVPRMEAHEIVVVG